MRYFVVTSDGQKFGPADVPTLQQWATEGRLLATSMLEEEISGNRVPASGVPGLNLGAPAPPGNTYTPPTATSNPYSDPNAGQPNPQQNPYNENPYQQPGGNYYRQGTGGFQGANDPAIQKEITNAWIAGAVGLLCCGPVAIWGLTCANKAKQAGHPGAQAPYIFNIVAIVIWVGLFILRIGLLGSSL